MTGRESRADNNLFYTCSLLEFISRKTKQPTRAVIDGLGREKIQKIYDLADVYHCEDIQDVADDMIAQVGLPMGDYDPVAQANYQIPTHWDIGKIYKRLISGIIESQKISWIDGLFSVYHSKISDKIHDFNTAFYYDSPENILLYYLELQNPPKPGGNINNDRPI